MDWAAVRPLNSITWCGESKVLKGLIVKRSEGVQIPMGMVCQCNTGPPGAEPHVPPSERGLVLRGVKMYGSVRPKSPETD